MHGQTIIEFVRLLLSRVPRLRFAVALFTYVLAFVGWLVLRPFDAETFESVENVAGALAPSIAGILLLRAALPVPNPARRPWILLALGCLSWAVGDFIWSYYDIALGRETPFPSAADAAYLGAYPLLFAGILALSSPRRLAIRLRTSLDALALVGAAGTILSVILIGPIFHDSEASLLEKILSAAYPLFDLMLLYGLILAIPRARDPLATAVLKLFTLGAFAILVTDVLFAYGSLNDTYSGTSLIDIGWVIGFGLLGYAATLQREWRPSYSREARMGPSWRSLMPLALLPLLVAFIVLERPGAGAEIPTGIFAFAFAACVAARQTLNFQDALTLNQRLRTAYESVWKARAQLNQQNEQLAQDLEDEHERATIDPLTGILNRAGIVGELDEILASVGSGGKACAVGVADIDHLKYVNDHFGHAAGDELIRRVVWALQAGDAIVGRIGGDEFLIILAATDEFSIRLYQREVRTRLTAESGSTALSDLIGGVSMGFAVSPEEGSALGDLLHLADARMYVEKVAARTAAA